MGMAWQFLIELILFVIKHLTGYCQHKHGNEPHGSTDCGNFHDWVVNCQLMMGVCSRILYMYGLEVFLNGLI